MAQCTERPFLMVFNFLSAFDLIPAMQTNAEWLTTLDSGCEVRLATNFQRDDVKYVFRGRPKLAKARACRRFVEFHWMIRASVRRLDQLLDEIETLDETHTHSLSLMKPLQWFVYNNLCGAPAWPFGCNDPLTLELEPQKPRTYIQNFAHEEKPTPWKAAEICNFWTFAPCFEAAQLVNLLLRLGWLDDLSQEFGKAISLEAHNSMSTLMPFMPSVWSQLRHKTVFEDNLMIGKVIVADIDDADLLGFLGLEFALYDTVSMESFAFQADKESKKLPGYHMMMSVAAFPLIPSCPQKLGDPYDDVAQNVPEELTRFIWRNFGSIHFDDFLIGGLVVASGMEPYTVLTMGDSNDLQEHHPNGSPFWSYKVCGSQIFYSKGALARWVRNVLRWHRLEFRRVQSLPNFPRQTFEDYMASVSSEIAR